MRRLLSRLSSGRLWSSTLARSLCFSVARTHLTQAGFALERRQALSSNPAYAPAKHPQAVQAFPFRRHPLHASPRINRLRHMHRLDFLAHLHLLLGLLRVSLGILSTEYRQRRLVDLILLLLTMVEIT